LVTIVGSDCGQRVFRAVVTDFVSHIGESIGAKLQRGRDVDERHGFEFTVVAQEEKHDSSIDRV
jgi:hypothetical protein